MRDIILPDETWQLVANDRHDARGPACNRQRRSVFRGRGGQQIDRIDLDGKIQGVSVRRRSGQQSVRRPEGVLYAVSSETGKIMCYDASGKGSLVVDGIRGQHVLATPDGRPVCHQQYARRAIRGASGSSRTVRKRRSTRGLKFATGLAYRPDQWLLSVADGRSKWVLQLSDQRRWHAREQGAVFLVCMCPTGKMTPVPIRSATPRRGRCWSRRAGQSRCAADDGPTQVILPIPDRSRSSASAWAVARWTRCSPSAANDLETKGEGSRHRCVQPLDSPAGIPPVNACWTLSVLCGHLIAIEDGRLQRLALGRNHCIPYDVRVCSYHGSPCQLDNLAFWQLLGLHERLIRSHANTVDSRTR